MDSLELDKEKNSKLFKKAIEIIDLELDKIREMSLTDGEPLAPNQARVLIDYVNTLIAAIAQDKKLNINEDDLNALTDDQLKELAQAALKEIENEKL